jgi:hypothetical protein
MNFFQAPCLEEMLNELIEQTMIYDSVIIQYVPLA